MYRKVLLAYHGTAQSAVALREGADIARQFGAELHLLGIVVTNGGLALAQAGGPVDLLGLERARLEQAQQAACQQLSARDITCVTAIREGDPVSEIVAYAHHIQADLTVIGHSEKGVLARWFEGATGARLLAHLPCSLLITAAARA